MYRLKRSLLQLLHFGTFWFLSPCSSAGYSGSCRESYSSSLHRFHLWRILRSIFWNIHCTSALYGFYISLHLEWRGGGRLLIWFWDENFCICLLPGRGVRGGASFSGLWHGISYLIGYRYDASAWRRGFLHSPISYQHIFGIIRCFCLKEEVFMQPYFISACLFKERFVPTSSSYSITSRI